MNFNKVILVGRLVRDPEMKSTTTGQSVCNFSIATSRFWTNKETNEKQEKTEFHNIVAWAKQAEVITQYLNKGSLILVEGRLETRSWQDSDGNKHYRTEVIAERIQLGPKISETKAPIAPTSEEKGISQEEIPIIEEDSFSNQAEKDTQPKQDKENQDEEEIDINKIPF